MQIAGTDASESQLYHSVTGILNLRTRLVRQRKMSFTDICISFHLYFPVTFHLTRHTPSAKEWLMILNVPISEVFATCAPMQAQTS
jgi:hypothetical protein